MRSEAKSCRLVRRSSKSEGGSFLVRRSFNEGGSEGGRKLPIVLMSIFILSLAGCAGLQKTKVLYPKPMNKAQELANYVMVQNIDTEYSDCKSEKGCYHLGTIDYKEAGETAVISGGSAKVTVSDKENRLSINKYLILLTGVKEQEQVVISFSDENIDGVVDYYNYKKSKDGKTTEEIQYSDKRVYKNGEWADATADEIKLFQQLYNDSLLSVFSDLYATYGVYTSRYPNWWSKDPH